MSKVYGYSDDVVVIEHIDGGCTEIDCYDKDIAIEFADGTVVHISYGKDDKAIWGIEVTTHGGASYQKIECDDEDADIYSDILEIEAEAVLWSITENTPYAPAGR